MASEAGVLAVGACVCNIVYMLLISFQSAIQVMITLENADMLRTSNSDFFDRNLAIAQKHQAYQSMLQLLQLCLLVLANAKPTFPMKGRFRILSLINLTPRDSFQFEQYAVGIQNISVLSSLYVRNGSNF